MDVDVPDPAEKAHAFFLSYARAKAPPTKIASGTDYNSPAKKLFEDLSENLTQLLPLTAGQVAGYMDYRIESGVAWQRDLVQVVGTCQIFVALLNESYVRRSTWCAMEWDLFAQRRVVPRVGHPGGNPFGTAILPVLWAPVVGGLPKIVADVQWFTPASRHTRLYEEEGVLGMIRMDHDAYESTVWKLARQVQTMWASYRVEPAPPIDTRQLRTSFGGVE